MKQILSIFSLYILMSCGTTLKAPKQYTKEVEHYEIMDAPGISRVQLFSEINSWLAETFVNRESVVQFQDKETGKVILKFKHEFGDNTRDFILDFDIKDESFRMVLKGSVRSYERNDDTSDWFNPDKNPYYKYNPDEVPLTQELFDDLVFNLVEFINAQDEDW